MQDDDNTVSLTGGPLKNHEYVLIKSEMTAGDDIWIQNHSARSGGKGKEKEVVFTVGDIKLATCQRLIKGWSLSRDIKRLDGSIVSVPIPFDIHAIEDLPSRIYQYILKKINEMNPDDEDEGEDGVPPFLPSVVDSSEDNFQTERTFRLKA